MTSKTSSDNKIMELGRVFAWQFRRGLTFSIVYWALFLVGTLIYVGSWEKNLFFLSFLMGVFTFVMPAWLLGDCFRRTQADFIHAMPIRRGAWFLGSVLSVLAAQLLPIFPCMLLRDLLYAYPNNYPEPPPLSTGFIYVIAGAATLAFCALVVSASGTYFEYTLNTVLLVLIGPFLYLAWNALASATIPWAIFTGNFNPIISHFSPSFALIIMPMDQESIGPALVSLVILTPLLGGIAYWLYCRRKSEHAGMARQCPPVEFFLRVGLSLCAAAFLGFQATEYAYRCTWGDLGVPIALASMVAALILTWVATELFYRHSLRALHRHLLPLALSAVLTALGVGAISTGLGIDGIQLNGGQLEGATVCLGKNFSEAYRSSVQVTGGPRKNGILGAGVTSRENLDKVQELRKKWLQVERASQYPYLPGRSAYPERDRIILELFTSDDCFIAASGIVSKPTAESDALLEECRALAQEIQRSEEYVDSLLPLNGLDALTQVEAVSLEEHEDDYYRYFNWDYPEELPAGQPVSASLRKKLGEALREDLLAGRCTTQNVLDEKNGYAYRLFYQKGAPFTATGGFYRPDDYRGVPVSPAKGLGLCIGGEFYGSTGLFYYVTEEMTSTYALLEKELK